MRMWVSVEGYFPAVEELLEDLSNKLINHLKVKYIDFFVSVLWV